MKINLEIKFKKMLSEENKESSKSKRQYEYWNPKR